MARRITIVSDENLTDKEYADRVNGNWAVLKIAHPKGGFHLESDSGTTVTYVNERWAEHGSQCRGSDQARRQARSRGRSRGPRRWHHPRRGR